MRAPSMRQRIDLDALWAAAREQTLLAYEQRPAAFDALASKCPFVLADLLDQQSGSQEAMRGLEEKAASGR